MTTGARKPISAQPMTLAIKVPHGNDPGDPTHARNPSPITHRVSAPRDPPMATDSHTRTRGA